LVGFGKESGEVEILDKRLEVVVRENRDEEEKMNELL